MNTKFCYFCSSFTGGGKGRSICVFSLDKDPDANSRLLCPHPDSSLGAGLLKTYWGAPSYWLLVRVGFSGGWVSVLL